jgi:hypothetical protein
MGAKDVVLKDYFVSNQVFADLFNGVCFNGEKVVDYRNLREVDTVSNSVQRGEDGELKVSERRRDVLRAVYDGERYLLALGIENQSVIDPYMPVRNMEYNAMLYRHQIQQFEADEKARKEEAALAGVEFHPGHFYLKPVITLVLNWDTIKWNKAKNLYDMFDPALIETYNQYGLSRLFTDYPMIVCDICADDSGYDRFTTDLKWVTKIISCSDDKTKLKSLLKEVEKVVEKEAFSDEASRVIEVFADVKVSRVQKGDGTMGTAFQELLKDQKEEGREEGL